MDNNSVFSQQLEKRHKGHTVNGYSPHLSMVKIDETTSKEVVCDCGKIIYYAEMCGCAEPHLELRSKENV